LDEQEAQLATSRNEAEATLAAAKEELSANVEAATRALEDKLMVEISAEQEQRMALSQRLDELDDSLKEGEDRTRAAEVELTKRLEDLKKWSEGGFEEVKGLLETLRTEHDGALGAELTRATSAEAELEEKSKALLTEHLETWRNEQDERTAVVTKRLQTQETETQKQLQEQDQRQQKQVDDCKGELQKQVDDCKGELQSKLDATASQTEAATQAVEAQKLIHDDGVGELREVYEKLKATQQKLVEDEEARASAAEEVLAEKLQAQEATLAACEESLQGQLSGLEEKQLIREGKLQEHYTQLVEASQSESGKEIEKERTKADGALDERVRTITDQHKNDHELLRGRLEKAEGLLEYRYAEQKGINDEAYTKDKELSDRLDGLAKKDGEESAKAASSAEDSEAVAKLRGDVLAIKQSGEEFHTSQTKTNEEQAMKSEVFHKINKDRDKAAAGFEEQLGSMVQSCADVMGRVDSMAKKEDLKKLKARVEGGFSALVVQMESERWLKANVDSVADGIGQAFMSLVDQTSERASVRLQKIEEALAESGAA